MDAFSKELRLNKSSIKDFILSDCSKMVLINFDLFFASSVIDNVSVYPIIDDNGVFDEIFSHLSTSVVMLQMPTVFVLLAQATPNGVDLLNAAKTRLPNKNYGTALGSLSNFYDVADLTTLPSTIDTKEKLSNVSAFGTDLAI